MFSASRPRCSLRVDPGGRPTIGVFEVTPVISLCDVCPGWS